MLRITDAISQRRDYANKLSVPDSNFKNPRQWLLDSPFGGLSDAGVSVNEKKSLGFTAIYRAVSLVAQTIAGVPKHVYRRDNNGNREEDPGAPSYRLVKTAPHPDYTAYKWWETIMFYALLWGNAYAIIHRGGAYREPRSLEILPPWKVNTVKVDGERVYTVHGSDKTYPWNDMLHFYGPSLDGKTGITPIQYFKQAIGLGMVAERFQAAFFGKGTHQGGTLILPEGMKLGDTDEEAEETINSLRSTFSKTYSGPENFYKLLVLEPGMEFKPMGMPLEDAQFIQTREFQIKEVGRMYGIPGYMLGDYDGAKYNNVERLTIEFRQYAILPWAVQIEQELDKKLIPERDQGTVYHKCNLDHVVRVDLKTRYEAHALSLGRTSPAWMMPEEIRKIEDQNSVDPNKLYVPKNMTLQDLLDQQNG